MAGARARPIKLVLISVAVSALAALVGSTIGAHRSIADDPRVEVALQHAEGRGRVDGFRSCASVPVSRLRSSGGDGAPMLSRILDAPAEATVLACDFDGRFNSGSAPGHDPEVRSRIRILVPDRSVPDVGVTVIIGPNAERPLT